MFLTVSAKLASDYPGLTAIITLIDSVLGENGATGLLRAELLSSKLGESQARTESALGLFVTAGVLQLELYAKCANDDCGALVRLEDGEHPSLCSGCGGTLFAKEKASGFRMTASGRDLITAETGGFQSFRWPKNVKGYQGKVAAVLITIKPEEFDAVLRRFPAETTVPGKRQYNMSRVWSEGARRSFVVATVRQIEPGTGEAQAITRDAIEDLKPACILVVGIAGGVPGEVTLGDVVFGNHVYDLTVQAVASDGLRTFSTKGGPINRDSQTLLANLQASLPQHLDGLGLPPLPALGDPPSFTADSETSKRILRQLQERYGKPPTAPARPSFRDGPVASSDDLVKDNDLLSQWRDMARHVLAVEMESAGVYRAARTSKLTYPVIPVRAISDVIGLKRDEAWTRYACEVAAAFAKAFILTWTEPPT